MNLKTRKKLKVGNTQPFIQRMYLVVLVFRDHPLKTSAFFKGEGSKICQICRRIVVKKCRRSTVQQDSSDLGTEIKRGLSLKMFINPNIHSWKARCCVAECTKAPLW